LTFQRAIDTFNEVKLYFEHIPEEFMFRLSLIRLFLIVSLLSIALIGCGGSKDAVSEDELVTDTGVTEEKPAEQTPPQQAPVEEKKAEEKAVQEKPVQQEGPTKEQLQNDLDAMKSENMQLKDENSALQQSKKDLTNKVSDLEAANAALSSSPKKTESVKVDRRPSSPGTSSAEEIRAYEGAVNLARNKNYREAMNGMQSLLNSGIKDDYADNCHYWLGECSYQMKDYSQAIQHFEHVQSYKFSEKKDDAQLMIAQSYERLGDKTKARAEYQKLVDMSPTSEYVKRAKSRLK
jgi:TolA-binding protein